MSTAFATFKVILGFITMGIFFGSPIFFLIVLPDYNPFRQINGVGWHGWMAPSQVSFDVQNPRGGTAPGNRTFTEIHGNSWKWNCTKGCKKSSKMQQMAPTPVALRRVLTSMPTTFHQGNRPYDHLPKKKHMHTSKRKGNTTNKGTNLLHFIRGTAPATTYLKQKNTCIRAKERAIRPTKGAKSEVVPRRSGPQVGKVATSPLPPRGSPPLRSGGKNQKWSINGQGGYITPAASGIPTASERGGQIRNVQKRAEMQRHPCIMGGSLAKGTKSKVAELGAGTKLWMCSPKEYHQQKFAQTMCVCRKTPLKPALGPV